MHVDTYIIILIFFHIVIFYFFQQKLGNTIRISYEKKHNGFTIIQSFRRIE